MKHLVGIRAVALRPDRLWRVGLAAGGKSYDSVIGEGSFGAARSDQGPQPSDPVLRFLKAHAQTSNNTVEQQSWVDDAAFGRQRSELFEWLRARLRVLRHKATSGRSGQPYRAPGQATGATS